MRVEIKFQFITVQSKKTQNQSNNYIQAFGECHVLFLSQLIASLQNNFLSFCVLFCDTGL
jgi:hypothetical protein